MQDKNRSMAGGILLFIGAAFGLLGAVMMTVYSFYLVDMFLPVMDISRGESYLFFSQFQRIMQIIYFGWAVLLVIAAVLSVIGGLYTLKRQRWGWALTGAIASVVAFFPVGIAALILVAQSRTEFEPD